MADRPRIGVTGAARRLSPSWWCLSLVLRLCGATPERISTRHPPSGLPLDGLIISGGDDISPDLYQGDGTLNHRIDPARDALEIDWIERALREGVPLLGICRGAQLTNVVMGGNLHQDITRLRQLTYNRPGLLPTKQVALLSDSRIASIVGKNRLRVNSLHHQAIDRVADALRPVGRDLDRFIQAVESVDEPFLIGTQWHPEYLFYLPSEFRLFRALVAAAADRRTPRIKDPESG